MGKPSWTPSWAPVPPASPQFGRGACLSASKKTRVTSRQRKGASETLVKAVQPGPYDRRFPSKELAMNPTNNYPKLHNAAWPGVVGKGSADAEPFIDLDTML